MDVLLQTIRHADIAIYYFLSRFAGNWMLDRLMSQADLNHLFKGGVYLAALWCLWFRPSQDLAKRRTAIVSVLAGMALALIVARSVALMAPFRLRPVFDPAVVHARYSVPWTPDMENWSAFPSDHAACFFALAFGLGYIVRRLAVPALLYTLGFVCLPRLYLGLHYASDMVAGAAIGVVVTWLCLRSRWLEGLIVRRVLPTAKAKPHWFYAGAFLVTYEVAVLFDDIRNIGRALLHVANIASPRELLAMALPLLVAAVVWLWYRRHKQRGKAAPACELPTRQPRDSAVF
jgi:membrane-associated phospholipid phosphatase